MGAKSQAERELILERIQAGVLNGEQPEAVRQELKIARSTYYNYLQRLGDETRKERLKQTGVLLHTYLTRTEQGLHRLDAQYQAAEAPMEKARIQEMLNSHVHSTFDRLQTAGFLPKRSDKLEIEGKMELREWMLQFFVVADKTKPKAVSDEPGN